MSSTNSIVRKCNPSCRKVTADTYCQLAADPIPIM